MDSIEDTSFKNMTILYYDNQIDEMVSAINICIRNVHISWTVVQSVSYQDLKYLFQILLKLLKGQKNI